MQSELRRRKKYEIDWKKIQKLEKTRVEFLFNFQMIDRLTFSDDVFEISFCQNQSIVRYEKLGIQV